MRILLIEPPFHAFMQYDRWYYPTALTQLAAVAHAAGHEVAIYDADKYFYKDPLNKERGVFIKKQPLYYDNVDNFQHEIWRHFMGVLEDFKPDAVGVSIYTCKLKSALNTLKLVREFNPAIKTCVGGAHVTAVPQTLAEEGSIDAVFLGYADSSFPKWISDGCPGGIIRGDLGGINFDTLPYVRRQSLLFPENYNSRDLGMIMVNRGCVGQCTFCSNSLMWSGKPKYRSSASVIAELNELVDEWKTEKDLHLADASFSDVSEEAKRVAKILKDFGMRWQANIRWAVSRDLVEHFMDCGCYMVHVGLESGSDKILKDMRKGCSRKLIREKAKMLNSLGIEWHLLCIAGFPTETLDDMQQTLDLALEIAPSSISLNSLSPLPGTDVYESIAQITPEFASTVTQLYPAHCFSKYMDLKTYRDMFIKMIAMFDDYNRKNKRAEDAVS